MSREIKFRAWHKNAKCMCMDVTTDLLDKDYLIFMQYTGFKDAKGKEIYEGDILKFTQVLTKVFHPQEELGIIEFYTDIKWEDGCYWIKDDGDDEYRDMFGAFFGENVYPLTEVEVVGDIYNNAELLRRGNNE